MDVLEWSEQLSKSDEQVVVGEEMEDIVLIIGSVLSLYLRGGIWHGI